MRLLKNKVAASLLFSLQITGLKLLRNENYRQ